VVEYTLLFTRVFFIELFYVSPVLILLILLISLIGYIIGKIEGWSRFDALYHAFINATTVGYGDFRPTKKPSKLLAIAIALVGLIFTGIVVAIGLHAADYAFDKVYDESEFNECTGATIKESSSGFGRRSSDEADQSGQSRKIGDKSGQEWPWGSFSKSVADIHLGWF